MWYAMVVAVVPACLLGHDPWQNRQVLIHNDHRIEVAIPLGSRSQFETRSSEPLAFRLDVDGRRLEFVPLQVGGADVGRANVRVDDDSWIWENGDGFRALVTCGQEPAWCRSVLESMVVTAPAKASAR